MGWACSADEGCKTCAHQLEEPDSDGDNIKMDLKETGSQNVHWNSLDKDLWRALVNKMLNLRAL